MADKKSRKGQGPRPNRRKQETGGKHAGRTEMVPCPSVGRSGHGADCPLCHGSGSIPATR